MRTRLDQALVERGLVQTRSQAESYIKLGYVQVDGRVITKAGAPVSEANAIKITVAEQYVSRAALKLASVSKILNIDFEGKTVLDVGSSTGGFTDYALRRGANKVIAVEVGKDQLHASLHGDNRIELHEQTDIRHFNTNQKIDIAVADVSFVSLRDILPSIVRIMPKNSEIVVMVKPQFEAASSRVKHKGVIKNDRARRDILRDFEAWVKTYALVISKADSAVSGAKGNKERFYLLRAL